MIKIDEEELRLPLKAILYLSLILFSEDAAELQNMCQASHLVSARSLVRTIRLSHPSIKVYTVFSIDI
jgi:hypothetical protein